MKFGRQLIEEQGVAPSEYKENFIRYKALKKYLKYRQLNRISQAESTGNAETTERDFLRMLYVQLKEVDRIFEREAKKILTQYEVASSDCRCFMAMLRCQPISLADQDPMEIAMKARWCRRFAELNYIALRKIAKKRDRLLGGKVGEEFMQACFRGEMQARTFMSASLLAELLAIEQIMSEKAKEVKHRTAEMQTPAEVHDEAMQAAVMSNPPIAAMAETEIESDHSCAICLDVLYQPVSLACGHKFCARCALSVAMGHSRLVGNAEQLLMGVACYSTERPCPCCRTALYGSRWEKHSPFYQVTRLTKLEDLIKRKYPQDWERRKAEDAAEQAALKSERPTTWESLRHLLA